MINRFEEFSLLISSINKSIQKIKRQEMAKFGLKGTHVQCMLAMSHHPKGLTASQMGEICSMDKAAISRAVTEMEEQGVIQPRANSENNYRALLKLSKKGQEVFHQVNDIMHNMMVNIGYDTNENDREILYSVLHKVNSKLAEIAQNGPIDINSKGNYIHEQ